MAAIYYNTRKPEEIWARLMKDPAIKKGMLSIYQSSVLPGYSIYFSTATPPPEIVKELKLELVLERQVGRGLRAVSAPGETKPKVLDVSELDSKRGEDATFQP